MAVNTHLAFQESVQGSQPQEGRPRAEPMTLAPQNQEFASCLCCLILVSSSLVWSGLSPRSRPYPTVRLDPTLMDLSVTQT